MLYIERINNCALNASVPLPCKLEPVASPKKTPILTIACPECSPRELHPPLQRMAWLGQATEVLEGCQLDESWPTKVVNLSRNLEIQTPSRLQKLKPWFFWQKKPQWPESPPKYADIRAHDGRQSWRDSSSLLFDAQIANSWLIWLC